MRDFRDLKVWEKAHQLTLSVYKLSSTFPSDEKFGLTSQLRRAASSIPTNIAESCGRDGDAELKRFMQIAMGSASETEYLLVLAKDLSLLKDEAYKTISSNLTEVKKMLSSFITALRPKKLTS